MIRLALPLALMATVAPAQTQAQTQAPAEAARAAIAQLGTAGALLEAAGSGRDQVRALTETVRAYEAGLAALRDGLRQTATRERALALDLAARQGDISRLLGVLTALSSAPEPVQFLHPSGPLGTARSGMIAADVAPALQRQADALRQQLEELGDLRAAREEAAATLEQGLTDVQQARAALSAAVAERGDLPRRFSENPGAMAALLATAETLRDFADQLDAATGAEGEAPAPDASDLRGQLPLPVAGTLLRRYGEADAAGTARPGWIIATEPQALVTAPAAATVRYAGPLLDLGQVVIVEPVPDVLLVFAGLSETYGRAGEIVPEGAPLGLMGTGQANLSESGQTQGASPSETLYVEVRDGQDTVDPGDWFALARRSAE